MKNLFKFTEITKFVLSITYLLRFSEDTFSAFTLKPSIKKDFKFSSINLQKTKRTENTPLYEPKSSEKMVFHPLGLYSINSWFKSKHKLNHNLN